MSHAGKIQHNPNVCGVSDIRCVFSRRRRITTGSAHKPCLCMRSVYAVGLVSLLCLEAINFWNHQNEVTAMAPLCCGSDNEPPDCLFHWSSWCQASLKGHSAPSIARCWQCVLGKRVCFYLSPNLLGSNVMWLISPAHLETKQRLITNNEGL